MSDRYQRRVAWQCSEDSDGHACIVYARTEKGASRLAVLNDGFDGFYSESLIVERAPAFDGFAPGPVPISAMLGAGWWWECGHCGHRVSAEGCEECSDTCGDCEESCDGCDANDQDGPEPVIDDKRGEVYCSQACADAEAAERKARREREESARRRCREVLALWPDADLGPFWPTMKEGEGFFHARLPGLKYSVTWEEKDPRHVYVHPDDVAEYQRIRDDRRALAAEKEPKP